MRYSTLARSETTVSRIAFGTMRFVPPGSAPEDWREGQRALHAAIDAGVNVVHSNSSWPTYAATEAALRHHPRRSELHHIIKVESPDYDEVAFDAELFRRQVHDALRHLHTERITVVQHLQRGPKCPKQLAYSADGDSQRVAALPEISAQVAEVAAELAAAGKIGEVATFPHTAGFAREAIRTGAYGSVVHFYSPLEPEMAPLLAEMQDRGMSFIGLRPLVQGLLTGARSDRSRVGVEDRRSADKYLPWYGRMAALADLLDLGGDLAMSTALRFGLAHEAVACLAVGLNTEAQVAEAVAAVEEEPLEPAVVHAVAARVDEFAPLSKDSLFG